MKTKEEVVKRQSVIENLEKRFGDVFNDDAINLNQATNEVIELIVNGKDIRDIRLTRVGKELLVGFRTA